MRILVFNAGSSSLKIGLFDKEAHLVKATFDDFAGGACRLRIAFGGGPSTSSSRSLADIAAAVAAVPALIAEHAPGPIDAIAHRIAHGGERFTGPALLDDAVTEGIEALVPLAPLHLPAALATLRHARSVWPAVAQWGVFDTSFHLTNPPFVTTYAVPEAWRAAGLRRFGFHGTSHRYVMLRVAEAAGEDAAALRIISCHLGNGASVCAINRGQSMESSMGMTPLEGLVMGTRSGDVDPGVFGFLARRMGLGIEEIEAALYGQSGLHALTGSADMRGIEMRAASGDAAAQLAIEIYAHRVRKYIGAYAAAMGGVDALAFTGGIGENSATMRRRICDGLGFMGLRLDPDRNANPDLSDRAAPEVQAWGSRVRVFVTETAEQLQIAREVAAAIAAPAARGPIRLPVAVSARHVHLSDAHVAALFGPGARLRPDFALRQPGNFAAQEKLRLEGPRGAFDAVRVLGPTRGRTQIEVSRTDAFHLGLDAPVRMSGDLDGTPQVRLVGPAGSVDTDGLIVAARHIHVHPDDARAWGLADREKVTVRVGGTGREVDFAGTVVRVMPDAFTEMHIDTDEANAAGIGQGIEGELIAPTER
jgi:acetate kinase